MIPSEIDTFLRERTAGIKHSGRTLYDHLKGTYEILESGKALNHVCLAGLFHSIYGTNIFRTQAIALKSRAEVSKLIGDRAERIAYIFCACDRPKILIEEAMIGQPYTVKDRHSGEMIPLTANDLHDLMAIELANLVEQDSLALMPQLIQALVKVKDEVLSDMRASVST